MRRQQDLNAKRRVRNVRKWAVAEGRLCREMVKSGTSALALARVLFRPLPEPTPASRRTRALGCAGEPAGHAREQVTERFRTIAARREAGAQGYGDHSSDWRAAPETLRKVVDAYNGANQHTKDLYIERIQREPQMAHAVGQLIHDRGLSR